MAAVAAEPGAAAVPITTITSATDSEGPSDSGPTASVLTGTQAETSEPLEYSSAVVSRIEDGGEGEELRHVRPEQEPAAGKAFSDTDLPDELVNSYPADRISLERFSPCVPGDPEGGGNLCVQAAYRSILSDSQPSAVFLHSFPAPPAVTEAGLSLAEPAEPTTNVTTNRAETADRDRGYAALSQSGLRPCPAEDAMPDGNALTEQVLAAADNLDADCGFGKTASGTEELQSRGLRDSSPPCRSPKRRLVSDTVKQEAPTVEDCFRPEPGPVPEHSAQPVVSVQDLSPGTEVRVSLDHVIDDALVVSFCVGEKVFSGVLMDISKR